MLSDIPEGSAENHEGMDVEYERSEDASRDLRDFKGVGSEVALRN